MKRNKLVALVLMGAVTLAGVTVYAGRHIMKNVKCPNCGTEIKLEEKAFVPKRGKMQMRQPKTTEELKTELSSKVAAGEITQEEMDKAIVRHEEMQKKAEERKAEKAKKLEELKTELSSKVAAGEITQEEMDKIIEQYSKNDRGMGKRGGPRKEEKARETENS